VEQGEYSAYNVVGVFSTPEAAALMATACNRERPVYEAMVAEWPLDPHVEDLRRGLVEWQVRVRRDGHVDLVEPSSLYGIERDTWLTSEALADCVWARDATHAVKIMNERRAQIVANGQWPGEGNLAPARGEG
jgi:hypothetical protein